jgi:hypothetical protein
MEGLWGASAGRISKATYIMKIAIITTDNRKNLKQSELKILILLWTTQLY